MKKTLLFSDVHLKAIPDDATRRDDFVRFLRRFSPDEFDRIICLGDLFDFWFEYRSVIFSDYFNVLRVFADWLDAGTEVHLVCGNHDFWAGRFLREMGVQVHPNTVDLPFGNQRAHLVHGDGINKADHGYHAWKKFARFPFIIASFRCIHPDWAMGIARGVSHGSRALFEKENPHESAEAVSLREYARDVIARGDADIVICGHAHAMEMRQFPSPDGTGIYINTGDWLQRRCHTIWDGENFVQVDEKETAAQVESR